MPAPPRSLGCGSDIRGASVVEHVLVIALVALACAGAFLALGGEIDVKARCAAAAIGGSGGGGAPCAIASATGSGALAIEQPPRETHGYRPPPVRSAPAVAPDAEELAYWESIRRTVRTLSSPDTFRRMSQGDDTITTDDLETAWSSGDQEMIDLTSELFSAEPWIWALDVGAGKGSVDERISAGDVSAFARALDTSSPNELRRLIADTAAGSGGRDGNVSARDWVRLSDNERVPLAMRLWASNELTSMPVDRGCGGWSDLSCHLGNAGEWAYETSLADDLVHASRLDSAARLAHDAIYENLPGPLRTGVDFAHGAFVMPARFGVSVLDAMGGVALMTTRSLRHPIDTAQSLAVIGADPSQWGTLVTVYGRRVLEEQIARCKSGAAGASACFVPVLADNRARYPSGARPFIRGGDDANEIDPDDVSQGMLGDCYLMAAMAAIARSDPDAIHDMIHENDDGTYTVDLYVRVPTRDGTTLERRGIVVTPTFRGATILGINATHDANGGDHRNGETELWPLLIEKAYAQINGGYDAIGEGGAPDEAMEALTGRASKALYVRAPADLELQSLAEWSRAGYAITASTYHEPEDASLFRREGWKTIIGNAFHDGKLVREHAYAVTNVDVTAQTVTVDNPWGWSGDGQTLSWDDFRAAFTGYAANPVREP